MHKGLTIELPGFNTISFMWYCWSTLGERVCDFNSKNYGNIDVADCNFFNKIDVTWCDPFGGRSPKIGWTTYIGIVSYVFDVIYFMRFWVAFLCELAPICLTCLSIVYLLRFFLHVYALYTWCNLAYMFYVLYSRWNSSYELDLMCPKGLN